MQYIYIALSYGEWAQKKFEQDMDELESGE